MSHGDFLAQIRSIEWNHMKFEDAAKAAPMDSLEIVRACANTAGGHLVFGFKQANDKTTNFSRSGTSVKLKQLHELQQAAGPADKDNGY